MEVWHIGISALKNVKKYSKASGIRSRCVVLQGVSDALRPQSQEKLTRTYRCISGGILPVSQRRGHKQNGTRSRGVYKIQIFAKKWSQVSRKDGLLSK
jgi:hypothetical protein